MTYDPNKSIRENKSQLSPEGAEGYGRDDADGANAPDQRRSKLERKSERLSRSYVDPRTDNRN